MQSKQLTAQVIVDQNSHQTDKLFDYIIPEHLKADIFRGMRVLVPFGKGNKKLEAYVINIEEKVIDTEGFKEILDSLDYQPILSQEQIKMIFWMRNKYLCKYIEAIHCLIPAGIVNKEKKILVLTENDEMKAQPLTNKEAEIVNQLKGLGGTAPLEELKGRLSYKQIDTAIRELVNKKWLEIQYRLISRVSIRTEDYAELSSPPEAWELERSRLRGVKQLQLFDYLADHGRTRVTDLLKHLNITRSPLNSLIQKGMVTIIEVEIKRDPLVDQPVEAYPKHIPSKEQQAIIDEISKALQQQRPAGFLLHGITGSGKTEIYLQLIEEVLRLGKQGIILVPEIALTPQTVERFKGRFKDGIALLHSNLSEGERYDEWRRIREGRVNIVIGARSAVFAPLPRLGIVIIDEEHEYTYKSEQNPKYHAREVADYRSQNQGAVVVLGSATPSLESYYRAKNGALRLLTLKNRATSASLPQVEIVDMKQELDEGNNGVLSRRLIQMMKEKLLKKEQIILFLNRRGYATVVTCRQCGHVVRCPHCDISMTYHLHQNQIKCHYCGESHRPPNTCSQCGGETMKYVGAGTQKLEQLVKTEFPEAVIERLDLDSTGKKGAHERILRSFRLREIDILIGTQMISKGLDFPNVTLVGIISIDGALSLPDFRGAERAFQLITQVAGRAGRGATEGHVLLQTFDPHHYSIKAATSHDYEGFYEEEVLIRNEFQYPPFTRVVSLSFSGKNEYEVASYASKIAEIIRYILKEKGIIEVKNVILGPNEAIITKINQYYRYQILLKDVGVDIKLIKSIIKYLFIQHRPKFVPRTITVSVDMNPYNMM
ncbi:primosomal protein N' [Alkaliphilus crotonatoxidans]